MTMGDFHRQGYCQEYPARQNALALSLARPLPQASFDDFATRVYFDNLLAERDSARADVIAKYRLAADDIVSILFCIGKDCAGAVSVVPRGSAPTKVPGTLDQDYRPCSDQELEESIEALYRRQPLPEDLADPSPLAGMQSKVAVTDLPDRRTTDEFAYRLGTATSLTSAYSKALDLFVAELGFTPAAGCRRILDASLESVVHALNAQIAVFGEDDENFGDLIGLNTRTLCRILGRQTPHPSCGRDISGG